MNSTHTNYCLVCGGNGQLAPSDHTPCRACNGTGRTDKDYNARVERLKATRDITEPSKGSKSDQVAVKEVLND